MLFLKILTTILVSLMTLIFLLSGIKMLIDEDNDFALVLVPISINVLAIVTIWVI
ncbi:MAG: hypothetical protein SOX53_03745 [Candidatus Onthovivens sp.]|nr:hypothetical protein [Candidatus Onthovivens sp.]